MSGILNYTTSIAADMSTLDEVMLPYLLTPSGQTLAAAYRDTATRAALESGDR